MSNYKNLLREICTELKIKYEPFSSDDWSARLSYGNKTHYVIGGSLSFNDSDRHILFKDKIATSDALKQSNLPTVPHFLIDRANLASLSYPIVIKPCHGTCGHNVFKCNNQSEAQTALQQITPQISADIPCGSPYIDAQYEYRNFYLNGQILLCYRKERQNDWRHNLSHGATPVVIDSSDPFYKQITSLAQQAGNALGAKFATIDILQDTQTDGFHILEINGAVTANYFIKRAQNGRALAKKIYTAALKAIFEIKN